VKTFYLYVLQCISSFSFAFTSCLVNIKHKVLNQTLQSIINHIKYSNQFVTYLKSLVLYSDHSVLVYDYNYNYVYIQT